MSEQTITIVVAKLDEHGRRVGEAREQRRVYHIIGDWAVTAGDPGLAEFAVSHVPTGRRVPRTCSYDLHYTRLLADGLAVVFAGRSFDSVLTRDELDRILESVHALAKRGMEAA